MEEEKALTLKTAEVRELWLPQVALVLAVSLLL
jgi:hypothetical protein